MGKGRAPCCDKNQVKRGPWSPAEDLRLITFIQNHGHDNWRALPKQAGLLRCGKSCRLRWINYLRPDVKRGNFTPDEEKTIVKLHETWGNKWSKIASRLPGRTDNEIKNVWNTHLKKRLQANKVSDSSGDESKESPTTSSSSSSSLLSSNLIQKLDAEPPVGRQPNKDSSMAKQAHGELMNNRLFCPQPANDPKDQTSSSDLSFESTNFSNSASSQADVFWPENPMGSQFDMGEFNRTVEKEEEEVEKKKKQRQQKKLESESQAIVGIEIPFECDVDFWNMLDLDDIELFQSKEADQGCQGSNFAAENGGELENDKWFKYLERELGLNQPPGAGEENMSTDGTAENSAERGLVNWSETDPAVDTCLAYFYDGFHRQP